MILGRPLLFWVIVAFVGVSQSFSLSDLGYVAFVGVSQIGLCLNSSIWSCGLVHLDSVSVDNRG